MAAEESLARLLGTSRPRLWHLSERWRPLKFRRALLLRPVAAVLSPSRQVCGGGGVEDALLRPPASLSCHPAAQLRASVREETMLRCINLTHSALNASQSFTMPGTGGGGRRGVCTPPHIIVQICACWECNVMRALSGAALRRIITPQERGYYLMRPTACILSAQRLVEISDRDPLVKGQRNNKVLCSKAS